MIHCASRSLSSSAQLVSQLLLPLLARNLAAPTHFSEKLPVAATCAKVNCCVASADGV